MSTTEAQLQVRNDLFLLQLRERGEAEREFTGHGGQRLAGTPSAAAASQPPRPAALLPETLGKALLPPSEPLPRHLPGPQMGSLIMSSWQLCLICRVQARLSFERWAFERSWRYIDGRCELNIAFLSFSGLKKKSVFLVSGSWWAFIYLSYFTDSCKVHSQDWGRPPCSWLVLLAVIHWSFFDSILVLFHL